MVLTINFLLIFQVSICHQTNKSTLEKITENSAILEKKYFQSFSIPYEKSHYILEAIYWRNSKDSLQIAPEDIKDGLENGYTLDSIKKLLKERGLFYYYDLDTARKYISKYEIDSIIVGLKKHLLAIHNVRSITVSVNNYMFIKLTNKSNDFVDSFFPESDFQPYSTELISPKTFDIISYSEEGKFWTYIREIRNYKNEIFYLYVEFLE